MHSTLNVAGAPFYVANSLFYVVTQLFKRRKKAKLRHKRADLQCHQVNSQCFRFNADCDYIRNGVRCGYIHGMHSTLNVAGAHFYVANSLFYVVT